MIMAAMLVGISVAALTFSSCSSDDNESPVSGELVSDVVPSNEGWSGNSANGVSTYLPDGAEDAEVYYAFSFSDGVCTDAVFNVVCSSAEEAGYIASMLNSGAWAEEEDEEEEDYYSLKNAESSLNQQVLFQTSSVKKALSRQAASLSRASSLAIACTQQGKVVFFKLDALKGCSLEDVKYVMEVWNNGLQYENLPSHCIFGEWNASTGKYTANNVYGFLNTKYEITTQYDGNYLDEFKTTLTMPNQDWAMIIEESWLEQQYEYEEMFGSAPEVTRSGNRVTMEALILDEVDKEQTLQLIIALDILNHTPLYISIF